MGACSLCPRNCGADRSVGQKGVCQVTGNGIFCARAAVHWWEEPCISGKKGSGAVFFAGCSLGCIYCQNDALSQNPENVFGKMEITKERLAQIFLELEEKGVANINLVTPTHYAKDIVWAVARAREEGLSLPIVYNCSGYETVETLRMLENVVNIYLTDFKYMDQKAAARYSKAPDYPKVAKKALAEMIRQKGQPLFDDEGMMTKGVIVRHLLLPGHLQNAKAVVRYVFETYGAKLYLSLMNQYTPMPRVKAYPELNRKVTKREYERFVSYALELGVEQAYIQEGETAKDSFIPVFDGKGILK